MSFESKNLSVLAYSNGFTLWHYGSEDTLEEITQSGYFNEASDMLRKGDMLTIIADTASEAITATQMLVTKDHPEETTLVKLT